MEDAIRLLSEPQITRELFRYFNRRQEVTKCWRKDQGIWMLKEEHFVEDWSEAQYQFLVECLKNTVNTGGIVLGAFVQEKLMGFASVESRRFGSERQYVQLSCIHVSCESRGLGFGKKLFQYASFGARRLGAEKLYLSAHPAQETQAFYHALGCVEAGEYDGDLASSGDCQLECLLNQESKRNMTDRENIKRNV